MNLAAGEKVLRVFGSGCVRLTVEQFVPKFTS